jgi:hypothetical protein
LIFLVKSFIFLKLDLTQKQIKNFIYKKLLRMNLEEVWRSHFRLNDTKKKEILEEEY